ncbi:virion structural protein [Pseudomonas phage phikF77]|uniref:Putative structural protein n=1 Tax=Pseudomonas phage phikF77 TaxID=627480 RepID=C0MQF6_9CAUD|nr:virion structural protein [Pseudomonas phage phikF77]CAX63150.1 putative structural protein [Pseudomonas phage phikF77]
MGKKVKKVLGKTIIGKLADGLLGTDLSGAQSDARKMEEQNRLMQQQADQLARNQQVDLTTENVAQVDLGAMADATGTGNRRRRNQAGTGVSQTLGINY